MFLHSIRMASYLKAIARTNYNLGGVKPQTLDWFFILKDLLNTSRSQIPNLISRCHDEMSRLVVLVLSLG